jgi:hypothetical protein
VPGKSNRGKDHERRSLQHGYPQILKNVGVTSQREIETAVRNALASGKLSDSALLTPRVTLTIPELGLEHVVDGEIGLC